MTTGRQLVAGLILLLSLHQGLVNATSKIARGIGKSNLTIRTGSEAVALALARPTVH